MSKFDDPRITTGQKSRLCVCVGQRVIFFPPKSKSSYVIESFLNTPKKLYIMRVATDKDETSQINLPDWVIIDHEITGKFI